MQPYCIDLHMFTKTEFYHKTTFARNNKKVVFCSRFYNYCIFVVYYLKQYPLLWGHDEHDGVSNNQLNDCLLRRRSKKHQRSASLAFVRGIHRWPVNALHKGPVTRKVFPFDDVIMITDSAIFRRCDCYSLILPQTCCLGLRHGRRTNKFHSLMWKWRPSH